MDNYYISQEKLKEYINKGKYNYNFSQRSLEKKSSFDLYLTIENVGYRIATYSKKTQKVILTCPKWHIPNSEILNNFVDLAERYNMEKDKEMHNNEN